MLELLCPVCGAPLRETEKCCMCAGGHSFDRAKSGYINLLVSKQSSGKQHGDDATMVRARRDFLDLGYYAPLQDALVCAIKERVPSAPCILDAGCGECYYTAALYRALRERESVPQIIGVDISKDALRWGGHREKALRLAVASVFRLPVKEKSCDAVVSVFAPFSGDEFARVLRPGGILVHVAPGEKHLWELKQAVYERPYPNDAAVPQQDGLSVESEKTLSYSILLPSQKAIADLFSMTPYFHKTGREDAARLNALSSLAVSAEFKLRVYRKK